MTEIQRIDVRNNPTKNRYEVAVDGQLALMEYRLSNDHITFTHTEVPPALKGRNIASKIAKHALEEAQTNGYEVRPLCQFVKGYIKRHPEYQALVK